MSQWLAVDGLQDPSSTEFLRNPDFRTIAAFFLGWVFLHSLQTIAYSQTLHDLLSFNRSSTRNINTPDLEGHNAPNTPPVEKTPMLEHSFARSQALRSNEGQALVIILGLCFASASVAYFVSLLSFSNLHGETPCAFVIAWGGMASQAARLIGLLILGRELRRLGLDREIYFFWAMLAVTLGLIFANNAIGVGTLRYVQRLGISLCYKRHFLPTGLASSIMLILLDVYVLTRTVMLITPPFLKWKHQAEAIDDFRVRRALSLLLLDSLTIASTAVYSNILVEHIPFSVGAVVVLAVFNSPYKLRDEATSIHFSDTRATSRVQSISEGSTMSIRRVSQSIIASNSMSHRSSFRDTSRATSSTGEAFARYVNRHLGTPLESPVSALPSPQSALPSTPTLPTYAPPYSRRLRIKPLPPGPPIGGGSSSNASTITQGWVPPRRIVSDQVKYAEGLRELASPETPTWKTHRPQVSLTISDGDRSSTAESNGQLNSAILGSDIIRANSTDTRNPRIITRQYAGGHGQQSAESIDRRMSAFSPISRDSMLPPPSARSPRFSFASPSLQTSFDNLEVVYEGDDTQTEGSRSRIPSRKPTVVERRNTFGPRPVPFSSLTRASHFDQGMDLADMPTLASPPGLSPRVRFASSPSGPRPLPGVADALRSPPLSSSSALPPPYTGRD